MTSASKLPEFDLVSGPAQKVVPVQFPGQAEPRRFILTEQTPAEMVRYFREQDQAKFAAVTQLEQEEHSDEPGYMVGRAMELWLDLLTPTIVALLSEPADEGSPATAEEVQTLNYRQKTDIIKCQDTLSGLPEALGNGLNLLEEALPRQVADWMLSSSKSEPPSPETDTVLTP